MWQLDGRERVWQLEGRDIESAQLEGRVGSGRSSGLTVAPRRGAGGEIGRMQCEGVVGRGCMEAGRGSGEVGRDSGRAGGEAGRTGAGRLCWRRIGARNPGGGVSDRGGEEQDGGGELVSAATSSSSISSGSGRGAGEGDCSLMGWNHAGGERERDTRPDWRWRKCVRRGRAGAGGEVGRRGPGGRGGSRASFTLSSMAD